MSNSERQERHHDVVLEKFKQANRDDRLQIMRRKLQNLESVILSLQSQVTHVQEFRNELLSMVDVLNKEEE